jgi:hypothetical protein
VGVVVAINGKAQLADIFASPSLFRVYWPKLLKSYVLEALSSGSRHSVPASIANAGLSCRRSREGHPRKANRESID